MAQQGQVLLVQKTLQDRPFRPAAGSARDTQKPAVVCAHTGNKTSRFAGCFQRERRDSNPRPPA
jgi:hypothetical protein